MNSLENENATCAKPATGDRWKVQWLGMQAMQLASTESELHARKRDLCVLGVLRFRR